jgi:photosynthetic reaction center H subunit
VPQHKAASEITLLEEEKIMAYYGGGTLYADPARSEPKL